MEIDPDAAIVQATLAAAREAGIDTTRVGFNAGSDARFLTRAGVPALLLGPRSVEDDAHMLDESITTDALIQTAKTYREMLERFLRLD